MMGEWWKLKSTRYLTVHGTRRRFASERGIRSATERQEWKEWWLTGGLVSGTVWLCRWSPCLEQTVPSSRVQWQDPLPRAVLRQMVDLEPTSDEHSVSVPLAAFLFTDLQCGGSRAQAECASLLSLPHSPSVNTLSNCEPANHSLSRPTRGETAIHSTRHSTRGAPTARHPSTSGGLHCKWTTFKDTLFLEANESP